MSHYLNTSFGKLNFFELRSIIQKRMKILKLKDLVLQAKVGVWRKRTILPGNSCSCLCWLLWAPENIVDLFVVPSGLNLKHFSMVRAQLIRTYFVCLLSIQMSQSAITTYLDRRLLHLHIRPHKRRHRRCCRKSSGCHDNRYWCYTDVQQQDQLKINVITP